MTEWEKSYQIESTSRPGVKYTVSRAGDVWGCTCPRWINQRGSPEDRKPCKHIRLVKGQLELMPNAAVPVSSSYATMPSGKTTKSRKVKGESNRWSVLEI